VALDSGRSFHASFLPSEESTPQRVSVYLHFVFNAVNILTMTWQGEFGRQIRDAREAAGISQKHLATKTSVSRAQLSNYENGKCDVPTHVAAEIAKALGIVFVVRGCRIGHDLAGQPQLPTAAKQLCLAFDSEHMFPEAAVTIKPMRESIVITTTIARRYRA
jgi:transcriptional regulator with XRE-family HTH domain